MVDFAILPTPFRSPPPPLLKDTVNRIGDLRDNGQPDQSFKAWATPSSSGMLIAIALKHPEVLQEAVAWCRSCRNATPDLKHEH